MRDGDALEGCIRGLSKLYNVGTKIGESQNLRISEIIKLDKISIFRHRRQDRNYFAITSFLASKLCVMRSTILTSLLALAATMAMGTPVARAKKPPYLFLIGDSTVAVNGGWGDGFLSYLKDPAKGDNRGKSGSTTVSWKSNGRWASLLQGINDTRADYEPIVTVQFGHNDQKSLTLDEFRANLVDIAAELRDAGATPVGSHLMCSEPILVTNTMSRSSSRLLLAVALKVAKWSKILLNGGAKRSQRQRPAASGGLTSTWRA